MLGMYIVYIQPSANKKAEITTANNYHTAAKYSNKSVFQHWFKEGCRLAS